MLADPALLSMPRVLVTFQILPTKVLAEKLGSPWEILLLLLMALACYAASAVAWRISVRRYTSASS